MRMYMPFTFRCLQGIADPVPVKLSSASCLLSLSPGKHRPFNSLCTLLDASKACDSDNSRFNSSRSCWDMTCRTLDEFSPLFVRGTSTYSIMFLPGITLRWPHVSSSEPSLIISSRYPSVSCEQGTGKISSSIMLRVIASSVADRKGLSSKHLLPPREICCTCGPKDCIQTSYSSLFIMPSGVICTIHSIVTRSLLSPRISAKTSSFDCCKSCNGGDCLNCSNASFVGQ
mmetsp:Transcript_20714/g.30846  ORF Transcript_20714/g.30846 Transcript_20714/m.30846 type:complete len:229 (+) Transcript_20714:1085-1771(+)